MKKILFALGMLVFATAAIPQARGADESVDFFYNNLSGGNWIDVGGYGYGWQPEIGTSDPNWRPYTDGYWAYTDYGWTWISYEDFGWATYHYGRWANLADYGWVWFPGSDLEWGPAWVSWRTGGDYIGWAPLPPQGPEVVYEGQPIGTNVDVTFDIGPEYYNFCDVRFIGEPVLRDRIIPPAQNVTYITNTVNVTNITVQNNVVYNYGPNFNFVNQYSSRPIQRLTIEREAPNNLPAAVKSGTLTKVQGNKLLIAAPQKFARAPATVKPPAVKAKVAQPKLQHGWKGVPDEAALKEKIRNQNPKDIPPPTRAAAREAGSPPPGAGVTPPKAGRAPAVSPAPRGKRGGVQPGATTAPSLGNSPSRGEMEKRALGGRSRPGATAMPNENPGRVPPPPKGGKDRGKPMERSPQPEAAANRPEAPKATAPRPEYSRPPRKQSEEHGASQRANPPQGHDQRIRFGTPAPKAPMAASERLPRGEGQPSGEKSADEARRTRERMQGANGQSHPQQQQQVHQQREEQQQRLQQQQQQERSAVPPGAGRGQAEGQAEGGRKRQPKETPSPRPQ